jgi:HEAT repeat protein
MFFGAFRAKQLIGELAKGSIRENADTVDKLRAIGRPAVGPLIKGLKHKTYRVKLECIRALGHIGDPKAIPALEPLLGHRNEIVREYALTALTRLRGAHGQEDARAGRHDMDASPPSDPTTDTRRETA